MVLSYNYNEESLLYVKNNIHFGSIFHEICEIFLKIRKIETQFFAVEPTFSLLSISNLMSSIGSCKYSITG